VGVKAAVLREIRLPYRDDEAQRDLASVRHQIETFSEALLLEVHDELQPVVPLDLELGSDAEAQGRPRADA
jgi:hypothetical protein